MAANKIIFFLPRLEMGGVERVISELSLHLPADIEKTIVVFASQNSYPFAFTGKIISLDLPFGNMLPLKICYFFVGILRMRKIVKEEKPGYVLSFGFKANMINIFSCRQNILRVDGYLSSDLGYIDAIIAKIFFRKAAQIICVSRLAAKDLVDHFGVEEKKIKIIYNPLNTKGILALSGQPVGLEYQEIFNNPVIINIGRFEHQKGQWYLIRAFAGIRNNIKNAQLVILGGQGKLEKELRQLAKDAGVEKSIHFLGWQDNPFKFMAKSKVFALSSLWEGLPYGVLEAMACGLPVVSVDCKSGPREILAPDTDVNQVAKSIELEEYGILTPPFSGKKYAAGEPLEAAEEIFKDTILKVLTDKKIAADLQKKSLERANDFDVRNIIKEWDFLKGGSTTMNRPSSVSVVIPTYNREHLLKDAMTSVLAQTYQHVELVVVDDCSKGDTKKVVESFRDPRVIYIRHENNKGVSAACNTGIKKATGDYIFILDDDDLLVPYALEKLVEKIHDSYLGNLGAVYGWSWWINDQGSGLRVIAQKEKGDVFGNIVKKQMFTNLLIKKEVFEKVGYYDEHLRNNEDFDFYLRVAKKYQFDVVPEIMAVIKSHGQSHLSSFSKENIVGYNEISEKYTSHKNKFLALVLPRRLYIALARLKNATLYHLAIIFNPKIKKQIVLIKKDFLKQGITI